MQKLSESLRPIIDFLLLIYNISEFASKPVFRQFTHVKSILDNSLNGDSLQTN